MVFLIVFSLYTNKYTLLTFKKSCTFYYTFYPCKDILFQDKILFYLEILFTYFSRNFIALYIYLIVEFLYLNQTSSLSVKLINKKLN